MICLPDEEANWHKSVLVGTGFIPVLRMPIKGIPTICKSLRYARGLLKRRTLIRLSLLPLRAGKAPGVLIPALALFALSLGLILRPVLAQDTPETTSYTLKREYKAKEVDRYKIAVNLLQTGAQMETK